MTTEYQPWQGAMIQLDPATGRVLAITVCAQSAEAYAQIEAQINCMLAVLNSPHVSGN